MVYKVAVQYYTKIAVHTLKTHLRSERTKQFYRDGVTTRVRKMCVSIWYASSGTVPLSATSLVACGKSEIRRVRWPRVDSLIWPGDLYCRKSIIFPIRSLGPIFRRRHFRLAVFLPIHVVYDYQPAPAWSPSTIPEAAARLGLSRTFDSRFQAGESLVDLFVLSGTRGFHRFLSRSLTVTRKQNSRCIAALTA